MQADDTELPRLLTVEEAKKLLRLGTTSIYALMKTRELRPVKFGRKTVFLASDIADFINRKVAEADARVTA